MSPGPVDQQAVKRDWGSRGFSCGLWVDPPGQRWEDFTHGTDELFMLLEGDVELEMQGRALQTEVGEEILIPAGVVHSVRNLEVDPINWTVA